MDPSRRESAATPQQQQQHDTSSLVSPTDLRQPLGRFQSRDDEGLSESFHSTDTVRRRPEPNYGTITSPTALSGTHQQPYLAGETSMSSAATGGTVGSAGPSSREQASSRNAGQVRSPILGPGGAGGSTVPAEGTTRGRPRPRKPALPRRASTSAQAPHRGVVFSVDDDISEVEAEMLQQQQQQRELQQQLQQGHSSGLTPVSAGGQQVPTLRRRGGVALAPAPLPKLHTSRGDGEDEPYHREQQPSRTPGSGAGAGVPTLSYQGEDTIRLPPPASAASASLHPEFGRGDEGDNLPADAQSGGDGGAEHGRQSVTGTELDDDGMLEDFEEGGDEGVQDDEGEDDDDDAAISEAESFTLKDRQEAINVTHPFGIRIWKPALYKKDRSVQKTAEGDIRSSPGGHVSPWLLLFNIIWTLLFGWWLACFALWGALLCVFFYGSPSARAYGKVLYGLAGYLFYPFGKFVRLVQDEAYLDEDQGEGRSISEYEQWQSGDLEYGRLFFGPERSRSIIGRSRRSIDSIPSETDSLLGRRSRRGTPGGIGSPNEPGSGARTKRRFFGRGQWNVGRVLFYSVFYALLTPGLLLVSLLCFFMVFWIPMGKVTALLWRHLRRHPLALEFESDLSPVRTARTPPSSILVCTYKAVGLKYWKYTIDGTNIFLFNLMAVVFFVVFDWVVLVGILDLHVFITSNGFLFVMGLFSIIPLAYFIGQAVASISAQSSMGVGAATNAFFSTIVEVFLYCVALRDGKAQLVEGSVIGSIFAGILFLPGVSMCFGAIKRKTQRFNAQSAGVTSTMLLFAVIGAFGPTLFYQIYGTHQLNCRDCVAYSEPRQPDTTDRDCKRCFFSQSPALDERFYIEAVRPYCYLAAGMLFLSYVIGLWFTLRTHAAVIWVQDTVDEKKHDDHEVSHPQPQHHIVRSPPLSASAPRLPTPTGPPAGGTGAGRVVSHQSSTATGESSAVDSRDSALYKRVLGHSLRQAPSSPAPHMPPPRTSTVDLTARLSPLGTPKAQISGHGDVDSTTRGQQTAETATTPTMVADRDARRHSFGAGRLASGQLTAGGSFRPHGPLRTATFPDFDTTGAGEAGAVSAGGGPGTSGAAVESGATPAGVSHGGHDAPNWGRLKSSVILMSATLLYAIIAEILVDTVDVVLEGFAIDEKFLGITLFALVPNTTEFLNGISFAMNGNIALSMEIGSAYALQVCLLQIPALVLFSALAPAPESVSQEDLAHYTFALLFPQWDMVTVILCVFLLSHMYSEGKSNYFKGSILLLSYLVVVVGFYFSGFTITGDMAHGLSRFDTLGTDGQWHSYKTIGRSTRGVAF